MACSSSPIYANTVVVSRLSVRLGLILLIRKSLSPSFKSNVNNSKIPRRVNNNTPRSGKIFLKSISMRCYLNLSTSISSLVFASRVCLSCSFISLSYSTQKIILHLLALFLSALIRNSHSQLGLVRWPMLPKGSYRRLSCMVAVFWW
jgi:hypothetical protein